MYNAFIVAIIAAISAIVSPIITAVINNRHNLKIKELDYMRTVKIKAIENYIAATSSYIYNRSDSNAAKYTKYYSVATLYLDENLTRHLVDFDESIKSNDSVSLLKTKLVFLSQKLNLTIHRKYDHFE